MTPARLAEVSAAISRKEPVSALRAAFPDLIFTECSEDDMSPRLTPIAETPDALLYIFTAASGHCLEITSTLELANGIIIASRSDDDD